MRVQAVAMTGYFSKIFEHGLKWIIEKSNIRVTPVCFFNSYNGWVCGVHGAFDTAKSKMTNTSIAIGYKSSDFVLHSSVWVLNE